VSTNPACLSKVRVRRRSAATSKVRRSSSATSSAGGWHCGKLLHISRLTATASSHLPAKGYKGTAILERQQQLLAKRPRGTHMASISKHPSIDALQGSKAAEVGQLKWTELGKRL